MIQQTVETLPTGPPVYKAANSFGSAAYGVANPIGSTDIAALEALGWTRSTPPDLTINNLNVSNISVQDGGSFTVNYELENVAFFCNGSFDHRDHLIYRPHDANYR